MAEGSNSGVTLPKRAMLVRGAERYAVTEDGRVFSRAWGRWRALVGEHHVHGYRKVTIRYDDGTRRREFVHRLIALHFISDPPPGTEVRHLDGDASNDHVSNLAWGTHSENMQDALRHGTHVSIAKPHLMARGDRHGSHTKPHSVPRGERNGRSILTEAHIRAIRALAELGLSISAIARAISAPRGAVKCVVQGRTWRDI